MVARIVGRSWRTDRLSSSRGRERPRTTAQTRGGVRGSPLRRFNSLGLVDGAGVAPSPAGAVRHAARKSGRRAGPPFIVARRRGTFHPVRMSNTEAIMWAVEKDPALRSDFCNLTILERTPSDERMHHTVLRAVNAIPRLGQRVVNAPLRIAPPAFADDPSLDLNSHVRRIALPGRGTERAMLDLCGSLAEQPFDRARPLWEFTIIEGLPDGRAALLQKIHHTITDGVGGLRLSLAFVAFERDLRPDAAPVTNLDSKREGATPLQATRTAVIDAATRNVDMARRIMGDASHVLTHPGEIPARTADTARL